jgi:hypothetical protein
MVYFFNWIYTYMCVCVCVCVLVCMYQNDIAFVPKVFFYTAMRIERLCILSF